MGTVTPRTLLGRHLDTLLGHLSGVYDGDSESIHQARVVTRRLREVLPLAVSHLDKAALDTVRAAGRHLGRARDVEVMRALLDEVGERDIAGVGAAALARRTLRQRHQLARRAMVKGLEKLELPAFRERLGLTTERGWLPRPLSLVRPPAWREMLRERIDDRAAAVTRAVQHATGIYFPNRTHNARVAIKKLRYAVEVAAETGTWHPDRMLKDLRRIQATLGKIHDAQVLKDALEDLAGTDAPPAGLAVLRQALDDEIQKHHAEYVGRRERLFILCDACRRLTRPRTRPSSRQLVAASVVAMPVVLWGRRQLS
jgi:CHAD domain-containing protein